MHPHDCIKLVWWPQAFREESQESHVVLYKESVFCSQYALLLECNEKQKFAERN